MIEVDCQSCGHHYVPKQIESQHRMLCGDATAPTDVERVMAGAAAEALISDPPYGMGLDTSWYGDGGPASEFSSIGEVEWDQEMFDPSPFTALAGTVALFGANYFCHLLPEPGTWWVWDKRTTSDGQGEIDFAGGMPFELIWINRDHRHRIIRYLWSGYYRQAGTPTDERHNQHPTQKPVAVMRELVEDLTKPDSTVLDPFAGSGSTLIACHSTGRKARLIEKDEHYTDVICRRYQEFTGDIPVLESTGEPHDFCAEPVTVEPAG